MKHLKIGALILLMISGIANAQDEETVLGKYSFEVNFEPAAFFDANADKMFNMANLKVRYFRTSDIAIRLGLGLSFNSTKDFSGDTDDFTTTTTKEIRLAPGIEKHFRKDKMVLYYGAELPITSYAQNQKVKQDNTTTKIKNPNGNGYFGVGLVGVVGFNYYIFKDIYVGAELTPGIKYRNHKDRENNAGDVIDKGGSSIDFGLSSSSGIKLGIRF